MLLLFCIYFSLFFNYDSNLVSTFFFIFRQVNKELLTAMEQSTDQIGKVFLELAPYLKFYSTYANDFESAIKLIEEWKEKHKGVRTLVANAETRPEVQKKLNSLLITPIQRVPR